jgi:hypothetical protein
MVSSVGGYIESANDSMMRLLKRYGARLLDILETPLPMSTGVSHELMPRALPLSPCAAAMRAAQCARELGRGHRLPPGEGSEVDVARRTARKLSNASME